MTELSRELVNQLLAPHQAPCISLYMPTSRHHPGTAESPLRYRALLEKLERSLSEKYVKRDVKDLLETLRAYEKDSRFWKHQLDGVAFFVSPDLHKVVEFHRQVPELVVVSDSFHLKPLLRVAQSADRFHLLCLSQKQVRLYEGNRYQLDPIGLETVPQSIVESMGRDKQDEGLAAAGRKPPEKQSIQKPKGDYIADFDHNLERFFRAVDQAVWQHHSEPTGLPLILATLAEYQPTFRGVTRNNQLMEQGLNLSPDFIDVERLSKEAWAVFEPVYRERIDSAIDAYRVATSRQSGSDDIQKVAQAAAYGKVHTLLLEADRHIAGKLEDEGKVQFAELQNPETDDVLDDIAERVLRTGGTVYVIPADQMPTSSGMAATYRY